MNNYDAYHVVRLAGKRGAVESKTDLINLMPMHLWHKTLAKLLIQTPYDGEAWSLSWAKAGSDLAVRDESWIRRLAFNSGLRFKLYNLDLADKKIGGNDVSAVWALRKMLEEMEKEKILPCSYLRSLHLEGNNLKDEHIEIVAAVI